MESAARRHRRRPMVRAGGWRRLLLLVAVFGMVGAPPAAGERPATAIVAAPAAAAVEAQGTGERIARVARKYKGAPYVAGGSSPDGFDCSGFTWYVVEKAVGIDIGRSVPAQWRVGDRVAKGKWRPGDLVFFENTFERGLSHVGIYLGDGKFIHAENERTGVVVSRLDSGYYAKHYRGARRLR